MHVDAANRDGFDVDDDAYADDMRTIKKLCITDEKKNRHGDYAGSF